MEMSSSTRTTIVAVFAIYTILLLGYSLYSRRAMKEGKGDYISEFYTGGRDGGILMTAMMVSAGVAGAGVHGCAGLYLYLRRYLDGMLFLVYVFQFHGTGTNRQTCRHCSPQNKFPDLCGTSDAPL